MTLVYNRCGLSCARGCGLTCLHAAPRVQRKVAEYDSMQDQLRTAQRQAQTASSALEEATEDRDMLTRQLADAKEDAERARVESEARWKRRLEDLQARAEADKKRAVDAKALEVQALLSREVCSRCCDDRPPVPN